MKLEIELGWPHKDAWPNGGHGHWGKNYRARKDALETAYWLTRSAMGAQLGPGTTKLDHDGSSEVAVHIVASPKTNNRVDAQNLIAGLKGDFDGISKAIGIDDRFFAAPTVEWAEPVSGGKVTITITIPQSEAMAA